MPDSHTLWKKKGLWPLIPLLLSRKASLWSLAGWDPGDNRGTSALTLPPKGPEPGAPPPHRSSLLVLAGDTPMERLAQVSPGLGKPGMEQPGTWAAAWLDTIQAGRPMPACPSPFSSLPLLPEVAGFNSRGRSQEAL